MTLTLYKCADDQRTLNKSLTDAKVLTVQLKRDTDLLRPSFEVVYDADILAGYNYAEANGRYYYITDITAVTGTQLRISCKTDVLMTYKDQILQCPVIIDRSSSNWNAYIQDQERGFYQYVTNQYVSLGDIGYPDIIVMATVG